MVRSEFGSAGTHSGHMGSTTGIPLTYAQRQLWLRTKLDPENTFYNISWPIRLAGELSSEALERSIDEIVRRHESLRTTIVAAQGEPRQMIAERLEISLPLTNLDQPDIQDPEAEAGAIAAQEARQPFNLASGPLIRARLIRLRPGEHILQLTLHRIIFDDCSRGIFERELAVYYQAFRGQRPASLPEPAVQYREHALWEHEYFEDGRADKDLTHWTQRLEGAPATIELPADRSRPLQTSYGATKPIAFSEELSNQLASFSREHAVRLFTTLLAGFAALLARYTGQHDIVIGTSAANRNRPGTEGTIGYFANSLVLRTDLSGDPYFRQIVARVSETELEAYAHQELPFEKLVEELNPARDRGRHPLFQVMFSLANASPQTTEAPQLDLSVSLHETPQGLRGRVEYNTALFDGETVERMAAHYVMLLESAIRNPELRLSELPLLTPSERTKILAGWNTTKQEHPQDAYLPNLVRPFVQYTPRRTAVMSGRDEITYAELDQRTNRLARYLRGRGVGPGVLVGVLLPRSIDMVVALLAILKAGGAYVPLEPTHPKDRIAFILEDTQVSILVTQRAISEVLPMHGARRVYLDADWNDIASEQASEPPQTAQPDDLAYVIFTSGSTGVPKGVEISHRNLVNFLKSMQREPGFDSSDTLLAVTTLAFDISGLELYLPLVSGGKVVVASREEAVQADKLKLLMERSQATVMQATPATWRMLIESGWKGHSQLKTLCGGEALTGDLASELLSRCRELWNMYGPTETTVWSSIFKVESAMTGVAPIGRPIANTQFYILDDNRRLLAAGVAGELYIGGLGVARGYLNRSELTAEKFLPDPFCEHGRIYRTGDRAKFLADGTVQFLGRTDDQIKLRGYRIEPGEIEAVLAQHSSVAGCAVALRGETGNPQLIAYVVFGQSRAASNVELRNHLGERLPDYMIPSAFVRLDSLPLNASGKTDRNALPPPGPKDLCISGGAGPRDDFETALLAMWRQLLGIQHCGVSDNFFELGGHSLQLVRLSALIENEFSRSIPLAFLFESATIEKIATFLRDSSSDKSGFFLPFNDTGSGPAFFCVHTLVGDAIGFRHLARLLSPHQRFYGIQVPPQFKTPEFAKSVETIAERYVAELLAFEPVGPYILGGWSAGVSIALEMAQQLEARGHQVALLVSVDAVPANTGGGSHPMTPQYIRQLLRNVPRWVVDELAPTLYWAHFSRRVLRNCKRVIESIRMRFARMDYVESQVRLFVRAAEFSESTKTFMEALALTLSKYVPKPYSGRVLLFKSRTEPLLIAPEIESRWKKIADRLEVFQVHGNHFSMMDPRNVEQLAQHLNLRLSECRADALLHARSEDGDRMRVSGTEPRDEAAMVSRSGGFD